MKKVQIRENIDLEQIKTYFFYTNDINNPKIEQERKKLKVIKVRSKDFVCIKENGERTYCLLPTNKKDLSQSYEITPTGFKNIYKNKFGQPYTIAEYIIQ